MLGQSAHRPSSAVELWWRRHGSCIWFFAGVAATALVFSQVKSELAAQNQAGSTSRSFAEDSAAHFRSSASRGYMGTSEAAARLYTEAGHGHLSWREFDPAGLSPLTAMAQELLWNSQHPEDCSKVQFAVSNGHGKGNGIGSILHVSGFHLAAAFESGRVFLWSATAGEEWTDEHTCGSQRNWECHFRAPSSCSLADLQGTGSGRPEEGNWRSVGPSYDNERSRQLYYTAMSFQSYRVPTVLDQALLKEFPSMKEDERKYWWRGQSVAYLMRLNAATVSAVRQMREDEALWSVRPSGKTLTLARVATIPFPPGIIHAHVRHGDKYTEMKLQGTERYLAAAEDMVHNQPTLLAPRTMFVSTEDPSVLQEAEAAAGLGWVVMHSLINRSNAGPQPQIKDLGVDRAGYTTRTHLLQLLISMEADAWITTRGSNWNRLLDELRCIWVPKCANPVVDVGTNISWYDYNW